MHTNHRRCNIHLVPSPRCQPTHTCQGQGDVWEAETVGSVRANCTASSVASEQDVTHRTAAPKLTKLWADPMARRAPPVAVADERRLAVAGTALRTRAESIVSRKCEQKRYSRQFRAGDSQQQHLWDSGIALLSSHFHTNGA